MSHPTRVLQLTEEKHSVETLFNTYKQDVFKYVMSMLQDYHAAEDVTQEVFLSVFRYIYQYRGETSIRTWIFAIAKNAVAHYKKENHKEPYPYIVEQPPEPSLRIERDIEFYAMVAMLEQTSRDVVVMRLIGQLRYKEIAAILQQSEAAVKKRYSRAIKWLREHMKGDEPNAE
jgi:RNA polymerase sigma factor, sigma-70 family